MASAQAMCVNEKQQKELVNQMVEKSKSVGLSKHNNFAAGNAVNQYQAAAVVNQTHDWSVSISSPSSYPQTILSGSSDQFIHVGEPPNGSSGAVVYYGPNKQGTSCDWLLAWSAPTNPSASGHSKVFVECGLSSKFNTIDWKRIQIKLNETDCHSISYHDTVTQTNISAQIMNCDNFVSVGADFGVN